VTRGAVLMAAIAAGTLLLGCGGPAKKKPKTAASKKLPPVNPEAMREFDEGMRAMARGDAGLDEAKERLRAAVKLDGTMWEAWHNLGVVQLRGGNGKDAISAFGRALKLNPGHRDSLLSRAEAHRRAGRTKKARKDYEKALEQNPEDRDTGARLASLLREAEEYEDALDAIRDTLRHAGANAKIYVELGHIYMAQGRTELAELVFGKATELDPKEPAVYNGIALLALEEGDAQRAFDRFDHATALDPSYLAARFNKASVLLDAGDYARAKTELLVVVESSKADDRAHTNGLLALGVAHRGLKEYDQAKAAWESVVKFAPKRSEASADALFNLAILEMDFVEDEKTAAKALDRYLDGAPNDHAKRKAAKQRRKELQL